MVGGGEVYRKAAFQRERVSLTGWGEAALVLLAAVLIASHAIRLGSGGAQLRQYPLGRLVTVADGPQVRAWEQLNRSRIEAGRWLSQKALDCSPHSRATCVSLTNNARELLGLHD
jgi:hypothetical protein